MLYMGFFFVARPPPPLRPLVPFLSRFLSCIVGTPTFYAPTFSVIPNVRESSAGLTRLRGKQDKPHPNFAYFLCTIFTKPLYKRLDHTYLVCTPFGGYIRFMYALKWYNTGKNGRILVCLRFSLTCG